MILAQRIFVRIFRAAVVAVLCLLPICGCGPSAERDAPRWMRVRVGDTVFTTDHPLCASAQALAKAMYIASNSACRTLPYGIAFIVEGITQHRSPLPPDEDPFAGIPFLIVRNSARKLSGFLDGASVQPNVQIGARFAMRPFDGKVFLADCPEKFCGGSKIDDFIKVTVLRFDPTQEYRNIYVEVTDGPNRGKKGWINLYYMELVMDDQSHVTPFGIYFDPKAVRSRIIRRNPDG